MRRFWFRSSSSDPMEEIQRYLWVFRDRQEAIMSDLQALQQKVNDQMAALGNLSSAVDVLKAGGGKLNATDQTLLDAVATALDQNTAKIAEVQTKVSNP